MAHDVFISYSHTDKPTADAACATLESRGIRCWIAPRDVLPGEEYASALVTAIHSSRLLVLVFSSGANQSPQVLREVERAVSKGLPILPLRIEDVAPSAAMEYYISSRHWLDALTTPLEQHLVQLADTVTLLLARATGGAIPAPPKEAVRPVPPVVVEEPPVAPPPTPQPQPQPQASRAEPPSRPAESPPSARLPAEEGRGRVTFAAVTALLILGFEPGWQRDFAEMFGWSSAQVRSMSALHLLMLAVGFAVGGWWLRRIAPRKLATLGGLVFGAGFLLAVLTLWAAGSRVWFGFTYGCLAGVGAGVGFMVALTTLLSWYPDRRGMIAGVGTAAFAIGAAGSRTVTQVFGWRSLLPVAIIAPVVLVFAARKLQLPRHPATSLTSAGAPGSRQRYALWILLFLNTLAGFLAFTNLIAPDGFMNGHFNDTFLAVAAATPVLGRLLFPWISDRRGRRRVLLVILVAQTLLLLALSLSRLALVFSPYLALVVMLLNGGVFGIVPALVTDDVSLEDSGATYGPLLSAWCLALVLAPTPLVWGIMLAFFSQSQRYLVTAGALLVAAAIAFRLRPPHRMAARSGP